VLAVGVAGGVIAAGFEDVAKDAGPHPLPILLGAGAQQIQLIGEQLKPWDVGEKPAVEVGRSPELPAGGGAGGVHLTEQVAEHVVAALPPPTGIKSLGELQIRQQAPILSEQAQNALEHEPLGLQGREIAALLAPLAQPTEQLPHAPGLSFSYLDLVEAEVDRLLSLAEEGQRRRLASQILHPQLDQGLIHQLVEVVNPQLIEVAKHRIVRLGCEVDPVALQLREVGLQSFAPALHLDQNRGPCSLDQGVRLAHATGQAALGNLALESGARLYRVSPAPCLQQPIHVGLGLAVLIPTDRGHPVGEVLQGLGGAQRERPQARRL